ncbi:cation diffusion facilitator family transporter [Peptoniphilus mikwangii]|uniref:cation diffusion facilitator family transporter n=1 Tax=Peptoniphilus mikwangii TaxID=1354300 RepID=UPI0004130509|nr:cation diffusion facilitator family transporter [Peptoniphilus mikwangii]
MLVQKILKAGNYGTKNESRLKISVMTSIAGMLANVFLCIVKVILFLFTNSLSILADAINNLTDCISSVSTIIGAKLSTMPGDEKHPYGHGRIEYISGLVVAIFVFVTGVEFIRISIGRIIHPKHIEYSTATVFLMILSIAVKLYMVVFYDEISKKINSLPAKAQSKDSMGDVIITGVVVISIFVHKMTGWLVDGYVGVLISLFVIYSGYELIRDTLSEIIGEAPRNVVKKIKDSVKKYDEVLGVHDIIVVNFGPQKTYITLDVELRYDMSLVRAHSIIDRIERELEAEFNCIISIHVDPVGMYSEDEEKFARVLKDIVKKNPTVWSFHDLYYENGVLRVDIVVDGNKVHNDMECDELKLYIQSEFKKILKCNYEINIDRYF